MLIVGIDQSTGARSNLGFSVIDTNDMSIVLAKEFDVKKHADLRVRLKETAVLLSQEFKRLEAMERDYIIFLEGFVMQGIGGQTLQRLNGAILIVTPANRQVHFIHNLQVKKYITGKGNAEKKEVAQALKEKWFPNSTLFFDLVTSSRFDAIDSIAIALTGWEKHVTQEQIKPKALSKTKTSKAVKKSSAPGLGR